MNNQQHGDYQVNTDNNGFSQNNVVGSHGDEIKKDISRSRI